MKQILFTLLLLGALLLSACAGTNSSAADLASSTASSSSSVDPTTASFSQTGSSTTQLNSNYENAVPVSEQLLLGTYQLAGTDQAVSAEQASTLLSLWNEYKSLSTGNTPAQGAANSGQSGTPQAPQSLSTETQSQLETLISQIQAAMTPAQIEAITAMKITQESAMSIMQSMGMQQGSQPPANGNGGQPPTGGNGGQPPSGGSTNGAQPAGTPPANGQMPNQAPGGMGMFPPGVLNALIQQLQSISTGQSSSTGSSNQNTIPATGSTSSTSSGTSTTSAAYTLDSGSQSLSGQEYSASATDESGVYVTGGASLALTQSKVSTSGDSSSSDNSSFHLLQHQCLSRSGGKTYSLDGGGQLVPVG